MAYMEKLHPWKGYPFQPLGTVYERVGISVVEVYESVEKSVI